MPFPHVKIVVMKKKIIFMGSPAFAVPILKELANAFDIITAVTQPDRPTGRGRKIEQSPIKKLSLALGLPLIQPMKIREAEVVNHLQIINPDLIVVAAYGQIQAAILSGDVITGVSIMKMDEGLDTGPIIAQQEISISIDDTFFSLSEKLSNLGASLLIETLGEYFSGKSKLTNQDEEQATKTHLIKKEEGLLDLKMPAEMLERAIRAYNPWPGTFFFWGSHQIKVLKAHILDSQKVQPNQHLVHQKKPAIGTGHGLLIMDIVQPAGKKAMTGEEFLRGAHYWLNN
jgi:methionyl-tRNA formyltransferase